MGAILFSNDSHVLLGKNNKGGVYDDLWVIPGGGIDEGETKEQAVIREVQEEVGIDISTASVRLLPEVQTGTAEKTLRENGERVLVDMTFYNFRVDMDAAARDMTFRLEDDFGYAEWVSFDNLKDKSYSPSVARLLASLDLL